MKSVLLSPHHDDETLFASFICQRDHPEIVFCLDEGRERSLEARNAAEILGCDMREWEVKAENPNWNAIEDSIEALASEFEHCYAPTPNFEQNGHSSEAIPRTGWGILQHDMIGHLAAKHFDGRITHYTTYLRWYGRERGRVVIPEPGWVVNKLHALACYRSQIENPVTRPHFLGELWEYVAE